MHNVTINNASNTISQSKPPQIHQSTKLKQITKQPTFKLHKKKTITIQVIKHNSKPLSTINQQVTKPNHQIN